MIGRAIEKARCLWVSVTSKEMLTFDVFHNQNTKVQTLGVCVIEYCLQIPAMK